MIEVSFSKDHLRSNLQVARIADGSVPHSESRAGNIGRDSAAAELPGVAEDVPVKDIERFGADLESNFLRNVGVLHKAEIFIVITEAPEVRDAGTTAEIKVEIVCRLEGRHVE